MKIIAKFKGSNSLGYIKNETYEFEIIRYMINSNLQSSNFVIARSINLNKLDTLYFRKDLPKSEGEPCEYSFDSLNRNWEVISVSKLEHNFNFTTEADNVRRELYGKFLQLLRDKKLESILSPY